MKLLNYRLDYKQRAYRLLKTSSEYSLCSNRTRPCIYASLWVHVNMDYMERDRQADRPTDRQTDRTHRQAAISSET